MFATGRQSVLEYCSKLSTEMLTSDYLQMKWKEWGDQTQGIWDNLLNITTDDPAVIWIFGTTAVMLVSYWSYAAIFTFIDMTHKPQWIIKYKIQSSQTVDREKLWKAVKQVLFNEIVITIIGVYLGKFIFLRSWTPARMRQLPSMKTFLTQLLIMTLLEEVFFYYGHRVLHNRLIYKSFHKKHHEWTAPIAAMTFYCHPVEHILINFGPIALLTILLQAHVVVAWTFMVMAIVNSINAHTGFYFPYPFSKSSVLFHDYHHSHFNYNFGVYGWLDKLHGTFKETKITNNPTNKK